MAYADQEMSGSKVTSIVIVALIHVVIGYLLISGLAVSAVKEIAERVTTIDIEEPPPPPEEPDEPPPDQPQQEVSPPPPVAPPPPIRIAPAPPAIQTQATIPPPAPPALRIPPPAPAAPPAPPPAPPAPSQARGASTRDEGRWAARIQENYPSRALREEVEGTVGVRVTVTPDGRAANCQVTASSGSSDLDQAACVGMERYARFNPALNAVGDPISGSYATRITYRLN